MEFQFNDGGRSETGFKGKTNDCICRAISIVTEQPYRKVYDELNVLGQREKITLRKRTKSNSRTGVYKATIRKYMESLGYKWYPCMFIGQGCRIHLADGELPNGRLLVVLSRHYTTVIDGVINDTYNPQRTTMICENGVTRFAKRCVYGYYKK